MGKKAIHSAQGTNKSNTFPSSSKNMLKKFPVKNSLKCYFTKLKNIQIKQDTTQQLSTAYSFGRQINTGTALEHSIYPEQFPYYKTSPPVQGCYRVNFLNNLSNHILKTFFGLVLSCRGLPKLTCGPQKA